MFDLRPYQREALDAIQEAEARGLRRVIVAIATGGGKTVIFSHLIAERRQRALVLAHRDELIGQAVAKIRRQAPELTCGVVKGADDQVAAQVVVASIQTLAQPARLQRLLAAGAHRTGLFRPALGPIGLVVVDEAHHYVGANTFGKVLEALGSHRPDGPLVVGFTATPERADRHTLGGWWEEIVYRKSMLDGIAEGWLVRPRGVEVKLAVDFGRLSVRAGDFANGELEELLREADAPHHVVRAYLEHTPDRKGLVFTPSIAAAHDMAQAFVEAGIPAEALSGRTPVQERRAILARLAAGDTRIVANAQALTEGFDDPSISLVAIARPTRSRVLGVQMVGRALRLHPGKVDAVVLDCVGVTAREDLITLPKLLEKPRERQAAKKPVLVLDGEALLPPEPEPEVEADDEAEPQQGELVYRDVDLLAQSRLNWIETRHGQWVLPMGQLGTVHVAPRGDTWDVVRLWTDKNGTKKRATVRSGLSLTDAQRDAEARVQRAGVAAAASRSSYTRGLRPTGRQAELIEKLGLHVPRTLGEASDLLTRELTRPV